MLEGFGKRNVCVWMPPQHSTELVVAQKQRHHQQLSNFGMLAIVRIIFKEDIGDLSELVSVAVG